MSTGEVYLWGTLTDGEIAAQEHLRGKKVKTLCGGYSQLMVLADGYSLHWLKGQDTADCSTQEIDDALEDVKVGQVVVGSKHAAALTLDGELYTWGNGEQGQLGLGGSALSSPIPQQVNLRGCVFRQISCGSEHMAAVTDSGDLYTWGRGFEGQTGHASKTADALTNDNVTGVQLIPKFMAAFMGTAIRKVSCGQHFTICLTEAGEVYTFGEGQSGQLGTGRCSKRVLPEKVLDCAPTNQAPIIDCDAGWAHAMCLSSSGDVFVWGFNLYGQLGLGDDKSRFYPETLVCDAPGFKVDKICAASHYSAALTCYGELFTWGSGTHAKLGHGDSAHRRVPTLVQKLMGRMPAELACGEKSMCVFSPTCVCALQPTCGPVAGKTELVLEGAGYWPSDDITVRFVPLEGPDGVLPNIAPRAAIGKYVDDTHISCKTPKLSAPCTVKVEVALNGKSFTTNCKEFTFYPVPTLETLAPGSTHTKGGEELTISGTDLHDAQQVLVRFAGEEEGQNWEVEGEIVFVAPPQEEDLDGGDSAVVEPNPEPGSEEMGGEGGSATDGELTRQIVVLAPACLTEEQEEDPAISLPIRTNVSVSFNGQDFHPVGSSGGPVLVHHAARLEGVLPTCAAVTGGLPLKIRGRSLFDSGGVQVHFVFPPEPKEVAVEYDEEGNPIEKPEEVVDPDQEVVGADAAAEAAAELERAVEYDDEGNPIDVGDASDASMWQGQVVVVPAVCLSSTELLVSAIPALQMTLREQRALEKAAAATAAEAAIAAGDLPPLDLGGGENGGEGVEGGADADADAEAGAEEAEEAEEPELDENGNVIEYDEDGNVLDLDAFVRNIAKGQAVACRVLVTLDGGATFVGSSDAPPPPADEFDEYGTIKVEFDENGNLVEPVPAPAPEPDGFTLHYYKPDGGFTLDPPCGPRSGGTTVQVNAGWLVPSSEANVKFTKGEFTASALAPCQPPPAPEGSTEGGGGGGGAGVEAEASLEESAVEDAAAVEADATAAEGGEAATGEATAAAGPGCSLEVTVPELGEVDPPSPTAETTVDAEATEGDGEGTEGGDAAEETADESAAPDLDEDGNPVEVKRPAVPPVEVEVLLALDGEEFCEDVTPFTYYEDPWLTSVDGGGEDGGVAAGDTVTVHGQSFKLKGFEDLATVRLSSAGEGTTVEVVLGAGDGLTVNDSSISFPMPDFAAKLKEKFDVQQAAAAAAEAAAAAAAAPVEDEDDAVEVDFAEETEDPEGEEAEAEAAEEAEEEAQGEQFTVEAFSLKVEVSLNSQQYHAGTDPDNEEEPLQIQFAPAVEED